MTKPAVEVTNEIWALWELATPVAVIARKLRLPVRAVQAVIRNGQPAK